MPSIVCLLCSQARMSRPCLTQVLYMCKHRFRKCLYEVRSITNRISADLQGHIKKKD